ncbi:hypothetical protein [Glycomyces harbinensis]|uniref:Heparinase II/III-like protein n=1 Tax=Glycomyces harbinensis TaxID=58114 RepID=A0A1G7C953_9ACTN|nr:hypothetical protein [Glycomyces harbinensis]SDE35280.1 hypothetical protein SAMN05216270_1192 [Glycomyces harbinensis]
MEDQSVPSVFRSSTTRRQALIGMATGTVAFALALNTPPSAATAAAAGPLADVAPLPAGAPDRALFAAAEQRLAPYLAVLAPLANGVEDADPDTYGFMRGGFWRSPAPTFNARVQENVFTLSWFHANTRSWNPYAGDPALLARLDAAIGHYLRLQKPQGCWPEYSAGELSRPATAFALGFLTVTLIELQRADALPDTQADIITALRTAADWFLDPANPTVWSNPIPYTNQVAGGLLGIAEALPLLGDPTLADRLNERIDVLARDGLSPVGYFYEQNGNDFGYSVGVMTPDLAALYETTGSPVVKRLQERYFEWVRYNFVREPDGAGWFCNVATSSRTSLFILDDVKDDSYKADINALWTSSIPISAAFTTSREDKAALRAAWAASTAPVAPPPAAGTDPQVVRLSTYPEGFPTRAKKNAAISTMPYLASDDFVEFRTDPRGQQHLFVRKPKYYFGGFFGTRPTSRVQAGLSFLWHPDAGMVLYGSNNGVENCWGTHRSNQYTSIDSNGNLAARYFEGDPARNDELALDEVNTAVSLGVRYAPLDGRLTKDAQFRADALRIKVTAREHSTERLPFVLRSDDRLTLLGARETEWVPGVDVSGEGTGLRVRRGNTDVVIKWNTTLLVRLVPKTQTYFKDASRRQHMLLLPFGTALEYTIRFAPVRPPAGGLRLGSPPPPPTL